MSHLSQIEQTLEDIIAESAAENCPKKLAEAISYAVLSGGKRIRPRLVLAVAEACGKESSALVLATAAAIEFLHCGSLVHDDLPCFDNAMVRRGRPSVHVAFDQPLAVLTGDALIVLAFETIASAAAECPRQIVPLIKSIGQSVGLPAGIIAGQAWESEERIDFNRYQQCKTGSLFVAATVGGAIAADADPAGWCDVGSYFGQAYQLLDDLQDSIGDPELLGKSIGKDVELDRPNAVRQFGVEGTVEIFHQLVSDMLASVPDCAGRKQFCTHLEAQLESYLPKILRQCAA